MSYYPDADRFIKTLGHINRTWFKKRSELSEEDFKKITDLYFENLDLIRLLIQIMNKRKQHLP